MRLDLPNGQWAELRDRLDYGPARLLRRAYLATIDDRAAGADVDLELVKAYVVAWDVNDTDGSAVLLSEPWEANDEAIQLIAAAAAKKWNQMADPKRASNGKRTSPTSLKALG